MPETNVDWYHTLRRLVCVTLDP